MYHEQELGFKILEVNYTYYRLPSSKSLEGMSRNTSDDFQFVVKAYQEMTHNLQDRATGKIAGNRDVFEKFLGGLDPLVRDRKLCCVLFQFPSSFHLNREAVDYLRRVRDIMGDVQVTVEFRNRQWAREDTLSFLRENGMGYCAVDEPALRGLMPFVPEVTSDIGYVRFHGRNKNWFRVERSERYDYLYSREELQAFLEPIRAMGLRARQQLVFFNNCHAGQAVRNAVELVEMLAE